MKINLKVRLKNPWFYIGLASVIFAAIGIDPSTLTSWGAVWQEVVAFVSNPFLIASTVVAVLGVFIDPTTKGLTDSNEAMTYDKPKG